MPVESLLDAIKAALRERSGIQADASAVANASAAICRVVALQLAPVIGSQALDILLTRALHESQSGVTSRQRSADPNAGGGLVPMLVAYVADHDPDRAVDAGARFFLRFTEMLSSLIGEPLTDRMLAPIWGLPIVRSNQG